MSRKVFISFLGTSNYVQCRYDINGVVSAPVWFVQEALVEHLCKDWTEEDRILIFCTSKEKTGEKGSKEINWLDNGQTRITEELEKIGLQHRLHDLQKRIGLKAQIEEHDIEAGFSEEEIWDIFDTVYAKLLPNDQIFFDVTHAFRSIPLFSIVLFNYSKFMKGTKLVSIMYGAFEKLGPAFKVKEQPVEKRVAPVIDLTNIARLQEYNQVVSELVLFGRVKSISDSIYYKNYEASDDLCCLCDAIDELDEYISTIQLENIRKGDYVKKFNKYLQRMRDSGEIADPTHPISKILDKLEMEMSLFVPAYSFQNIEASIEWANRHSMVLQEYPLAEEYIIYRVMSIFKDGLNDNRISEQDGREIFRSLLGIRDRDLDEMNLTDRIFKKSNVFVSYVRKSFPPSSTNSQFLKEIKRNGYSELRLRRNSLAHADGKYSFQDLAEKFLDCYSNCMGVLYDYETI